MNYKGKEYKKIGHLGCGGCSFIEDDNACDRINRKHKCGEYIWKLKEESAEWKELEIDDLPSDIFKSSKIYQVQVSSGFDYTDSADYESERFYTVIKNLVNGIKYRYRKHEPKAPSHEEIAWEYVNKNLPALFDCNNPEDVYQEITVSTRNKMHDAFIAGHKSATITPEKTQ